MVASGVGRTAGWLKITDTPIGGGFKMAATKRKIRESATEGNLPCTPSGVATTGWQLPLQKYLLN